MLSFVNADSDYRESVEAPGRELAAAFEAARQVPAVDLDADDITKAILLRLRSFFRTQDTIKAELNKVYAAPAADFLVETKRWSPLLGQVGGGVKVDRLHDYAARERVGPA